MFQKTGSNYGVNEVLLASVLGSVVFSLFAAQPLVIVGVTGTLASRTRRRQILTVFDRPNYRLQLVCAGQLRQDSSACLTDQPLQYRVRHHEGNRGQLHWLYGLDRHVSETEPLPPSLKCTLTCSVQMVPHPALDPRRHKLMQLAALGDALPLRHLRLLRRLHLPAKGHPGARAPRQRERLLPVHPGGPASLHGRLRVRPAGDQQPLPAPGARIPQGLRHAADARLLHGLRVLWTHARGRAGEAADGRCVRAHEWEGLAGQLLGPECW